MAQHLLIASATWKYLFPDLDRPMLEQVLDDVATLFTSKLGGYKRELTAVSANPKAADLTTALDLWFADPARKSDDWVVFYYTGHAEIVGADALYLLTSDFNGFHASSAFDFRKFSDFLLAPDANGQSRRVKNLLIILDTCFSGQGLINLSEQLAKACRDRGHNAYYLLAAALPNQEANSGALARALIAAIGDLSSRSITQEYLFLDQIVPLVNRELDKKGVHEALRLTVESTKDTPAFFPNPSFIDTDGKPVTAGDAMRAISDEEFRDHWAPRARGVEFDTQAGYYFSGRDRVLEKLARALRDDEDTKTRIVTGSPGAGKSAILSQLLAWSAPELRRGWPITRNRFDLPRFDLALHAKGKTLEDVTVRLAKVLETAPDREAILDKLTKSNKTIRIVIDALDEAAEPARIAWELLTALGAAPNVNLLVGTRSTELERLPNAEIIDIDQPEYAERRDLIQYAKARLLRSDEPNSATPYRNKEDLAERVAEAVADRAYPNFLVARLVIEDLLSREDAVDPAKQMITFPSKVAEAFQLYLARFGANEKWIRDLLLPLAYAKGQGLPWDNLWAPVASALADDRAYSDDDIRELLMQAGSFILESTEEGRSVYRLFHQALADTLQTGRDSVLIASVYTASLSDSVPKWSKRVGDAEKEGKDWRIANRYVRSYLSLHAEESKGLSRLIEQPLYLLTADPTRLLSSIATSTEALPRDKVGIYRELSHHIGRQTISVAAAYLSLLARKRSLDEWAEEVEQLPLEPAWKVPWARWKSRAPSRALAKGERGISCLSTATLADGRGVLLVGRELGTAEVWDAENGLRLLGWHLNGYSDIKKMSLARVDGHDVVIVASRTGDIATRDLKTDVVRVSRAEQNSSDSHVTALAVIECDGQEGFVTAHWDDRLVRWSLPDLQPVIQREQAASIYDLQRIELEGRTLLFGVGDSLGHLGADEREFRPRKDNPSTLYLIEPKELLITWSDHKKAKGYIPSSACAKLFDRELGVFHRIGTQARHKEVWDLGARRLVANANGEAYRCWFHHFRGESLLVSEYCAEFRVQQLKARTDNGSFGLDVEDVGRLVQLQGERFTELVRIQRRAVTFSSVGDYVRAWDLDDLVEEALNSESGAGHRRLGGPPPEYVSDLVEGSAEQLFVAQNGRVLAIDPRDGHTLWESPFQSKDAIMRIAVVRGRSELYLADGRGSIHILDLAQGGKLKESIRIGASIETLEVLEIGDELIALINQNVGLEWSTSIWDLNKREELPTAGAYKLEFGQEDKTLKSLAALPINGGIRFAFASRYGKVMVGEYDLVQRQPKEQRPFKFQEWYIPEGNNCYTPTMDATMRDTQPLLVAGTENGIVVLWDFSTGEVVASRPNAHFGSVRAIRFSRGKTKRLVSVGDDGAIRIWSLGLEELWAVEVGEALSKVEWVGERKVVVGGKNGVLAVELKE